MLIYTHHVRFRVLILFILILRIMQDHFLIHFITLDCEFIFKFCFICRNPSYPAFMTLLANFLTGSASHYRRITGLTLLFMLMSWDHVSFQVLQKNRTNRIICHLSIHLSIYVIIIMCYIQKDVL